VGKGGGKTRRLYPRASREANKLHGIVEVFRLISLFLDGPDPSNRFGLGRSAVAVLAALRTHYLGILVGHFMQEGGKCLAAVIA
jgi:hypothetical protein